MRVFLLTFLFLSFSNAASLRVDGSFKSGIYTSPSKQLSCNLEEAIDNFDIKFLADLSVPDSELLTAMAEHQDIYINYLVILAKENSGGPFIINAASNISKLDQLAHNFNNLYLQEEQLLDVAIVAEKILKIGSKQAKVVSYEVSFDNRTQIFSASFQKFDDFYLVTSVMPTLVETTAEVLSLQALSNMAELLVASCDVSLTKKGL